ncbi:hypothetical protein ACFPM3_20365 [Streptomyces coeruleoprunus]|uniref:Uncharacterized protein n=1 Tax=Streptomyces coeruleoprunus TaxID=285563 RepID=A0ABV9XJA7_9ACTN
MWTDDELDVMRHALDLLGDQIALRGHEYDESFDRAHTSLSLRIADELSRREALRRLR